MEDMYENILYAVYVKNKTSFTLDDITDTDNIDYRIGLTVGLYMAYLIAKNLKSVNEITEETVIEQLDADSKF